MEVETTERMDWKVHVPKLFEETLKNEGCSILHIPLTILLGILGKVAARAIELDDPKLNLLMVRLTLYSCADPMQDDYNPNIAKELEKTIQEQSKKH